MQKIFFPLKKERKSGKGILFNKLVIHYFMNKQIFTSSTFLNI